MEFNKSRKNRFLELIQKVFGLINGETLSESEDNELYEYFEFVKHQLHFNDRACYQEMTQAFSERKTLTLAEFRYLFEDLFPQNAYSRSYDLETLKSMDVDSKIELLEFLVSLPMDFQNKSKIDSFGQLIEEIDYSLSWIDADPKCYQPEFRSSIPSEDDISEDVHLICVQIKELLE